jgi:hypothetical protein
MVKKGLLLKITAIFLFSTMLHLSSQSQDRKYFIITGKIVSESVNSLNGAVVQIIKNNKPAILSEIPDHGRFRLELEYNAEYQLTFKEEGHHSKTIIVNTEIPQEVVQRPSNFPHFLMAVQLSKNNQDATNLYSGSQKQQICYSTQQDCFARVPTMFDIEYVDKGNSAPNPSIQLQVNRDRMQTYQVF